MDLRINPTQTPATIEVERLGHFFFFLWISGLVNLISLEKSTAYFVFVVAFFSFSPKRREIVHRAALSFLA